MSKKLPQDEKSKKKFKNATLYFLDNNIPKDLNILKEETKLCKRHIRQQISDISMYYPVISNSKQKGYRIAKKIDELNTLDELIEERKKVEITINEINSRIAILKGKLKPLIAWEKVELKKENELLLKLIDEEEYNELYI